MGHSRLWVKLGRHERKMTGTKLTTCQGCARVGPSRLRTKLGRHERKMTGTKLTDCQGCTRVGPSRLRPKLEVVRAREARHGQKKGREGAVLVLVIFGFEFEFVYASILPFQLRYAEWDCGSLGLALGLKGVLPRCREAVPIFRKRTPKGCLRRQDYKARRHKTNGAESCNGKLGLEKT